MHALVMSSRIMESSVEPSGEETRLLSGTKSIPCPSKASPRSHGCSRMSLPPRAELVHLPESPPSCHSLHTLRRSRPKPLPSANAPIRCRSCRTRSRKCQSSRTGSGPEVGQSSIRAPNTLPRRHPETGIQLRGVDRVMHSVFDGRDNRGRRVQT